MSVQTDSDDGIDNINVYKKVIKKFKLENYLINPHEQKRTNIFLVTKNRRHQ